MVKFAKDCIEVRSIENKPALVQITVWRWSGGKALFEPMITDACMRHAASMI